MEAGKVTEKVVVEDRKLAVLGELHVHFDDSRALAIGLIHRVHSILDRQSRILSLVGSDSMVADGNRPDTELQEVLRRAPFILIFGGFIGRRGDTTAETESQSPEPY